MARDSNKSRTKEKSQAYYAGEQDSPVVLRAGAEYLEKWQK